jgi:hypothetical protein
MSVRAYNELLDVLAWWKRQGLNRGGKLKAGFDEASIIDVANNTAATCDLGDVLEVDDVVVNPANDQDSFRFHPMLKGTIPATAGKPVAIVLRPCEKSTLVPAVLAGYAVTKVQIPTGGDPTLGYAESVAGTKHNLVIAQTGQAQIIWLDSQAAPGESGDIRYAIVRLGKGGGAAGTSWFQLDCDPSVTADNIPLSYIAADLWGQSGTAQVMTGCFGNPPDSSLYPALAQKPWASGGTQGHIVPGKTVWLWDATATPPGSSSPAPGQVLALAGDWVTAENTGTTVTNPGGVSGEFPVYRVTNRLSQEMSFYGVLPDGQIVTPAGGTSPFAMVTLDVGISVRASQTKLLDTGQMIGALNSTTNVLVRYSPMEAMLGNGAWWIEGWLCIPNPAD